MLYIGDPTGVRTRVTAVKGRCLRPLDHRAIWTGNVLFSQAASHQVSSALESLTSVFEMGTGGSSPPLSPDLFLYSFYLKLKRKTISSFTIDHLWLSVRSISIGQLHTLLHLHLRPINQLVFLGSSTCVRRSFLVGGFALRCFQRLSRPYLATRLCSWHCNRCTSGMSTPVLSY